MPPEKKQSSENHSSPKPSFSASPAVRAMVSGGVRLPNTIPTGARRLLALLVPLSCIFNLPLDGLYQDDAQ